MRKRFVIERCAVLFAAVGICASTGADGWSISTPYVSEVYSSVSDIPAVGGADSEVPENAYCTAKVKINTVIENAANGQVDESKQWEITVDSPTGGWTAGETHTYFEIHYDGSVQESHQFVIDPPEE